MFGRGESWMMGGSLRRTLRSCNPVVVLENPKDLREAHFSWCYGFPPEYRKLATLP